MRSLLAAVFLVSAACGSAATRQPATIDVTIDSIAFAEVKDALRVGDTVVWINKDVVPHTATGKNGEWRVEIPANARASLVMKTAGVVEYYCEYHPNMTGRLVIEPAESP
jgi:plastocyanin